MSSGACLGGGGASAGAVAGARSRVSAEQLELLLCFMEEHAEFAAGKQAVYSRFSASKLWRLLAERLNAAAPDSAGARKSPDKWCRYWADIKYKARKKTAAGGALGDLSSAEERLRAILGGAGGGGGGGAGAGYGGGGGGGGAHSDEERERKPALDDDACSDTSAGLGAGPAGGVGADELLAEAAMRSALAAEKQAEAVAQGVELLRELVALVRERGAPHAPGPAPAPHAAHHDHLAAMHHHRL